MSTSRQTIKQRFGIVGDSPKLNTALDIALQVAPTEVTVLVVGENGSGKDVFASMIHQLSPRKHRPFIAINCGAIPEGTIDSELFGHEKGSFTSAYDSRKGYFEEVNGGIIFLDEIAEMPLHTQSRLLRVLENGEFLRVGSSKVQKTDVRVVAATNKNLVEQIRQGKFREDLYFRLNTITIYVPPLRERGADIELLFRYFANEFATRYGREPIVLDEGASALLYEYHWPGNVRELRNFVEKLTVLSPQARVSSQMMRQHLPLNESKLPVHLPSSSDARREDTANGTVEGLDPKLLVRMFYEIKTELADLRRTVAALTEAPFDPIPTPAYPPRRENDIAYPEVIIHPPAGGNALAVRTPQPEPRFGRGYGADAYPADQPPLLEESLSLERKERDLIAKALAKYNHNRKKAATELGISERTLYRKIKSYGLEH